MEIKLFSSFLTPFQLTVLQGCPHIFFTYVTPFIWTGVLVVRRSTMSLTTNFQWLLNGCNLKNILQWKM